MNKLSEIIKEMEKEIEWSESCIKNGVETQCYDDAHHYQVKRNSLLYFLPKLKALEDDCWISVEDRLPTIKGLYLAYVIKHPFLGPAKGCKVAYYGFGIDEDLTERQWSFAMKDITVTHWQPLPTPPKSKEEKQNQTQN